MPDVVVTVPKTFRWGPHVGLAAWAAEGCLPGDPGDGDLYEFSTFGACPAIRPGERVYVVCEGHVRGYAPLVQLEYAGGTVRLLRGGGAVAATVRGPDGRPLPVQGFRGWRYRWWDLAEEVPFPDWRTYGTRPAVERLGGLFEGVGR